jgi:hypothetical protein
MQDSLVAVHVVRCRVSAVQTSKGFGFQVTEVALSEKERGAEESRDDQSLNGPHDMKSEHSNTIESKTANSNVLIESEEVVPYEDYIDITLPIVARKAPRMMIFRVHSKELRDRWLHHITSAQVCKAEDFIDLC